MTNIKTNLKIKNISKNINFENNLKLNGIIFNYDKNSYVINNINHNNIELVSNIISWAILFEIEKNKKEQLLNEGYSTTSVSYTSKNPIIAIYIKEKLYEFLINDNDTLDLKKFIKFNLNNIDNKYYELINNISKNSWGYVSKTLRRVLFKDSKFNNIKELTFDFSSCIDIDDYTCNIYTDNNMKISSLEIDTTIKLYNIVISVKNNNGIIDTYLNSILATIFSLKPKKIIFTGNYKEEVINEILKELINYQYDIDEYELR